MRVFFCLPIATDVKCSFLNDIKKKYISKLLQCTWLLQRWRSKNIWVQQVQTWLETQRLPATFHWKMWEHNYITKKKTVFIRAAEGDWLLQHHKWRVLEIEFQKYLGHTTQRCTAKSQINSKILFVIYTMRVNRRQIKNIKKELILGLQQRILLL